MRSEEVVMSLILDFAKNKPPIRAVYMNGSRVNKNVNKDIMQDYDIVYVVTSTSQFIEDKTWIKEFGEIAIMQEPDNSAIFKCDTDSSEKYTFLMQFKDGIRIDLTFASIPYALKNIYEDKLTKILLDKDRLLPEIEEASDIDYITTKPTQAEFNSCCNEFWWVCPYIAKGLWRNELLYAMDHLNLYVRPMLIKILSWKVAYQFNFSISIGKCAKYLQKYLNSEDLSKLEDTYTLLNKDCLWDTLYALMDYFKEKALEVSKLLNYKINLVEIENTYEFINKIKNNEL